MVAGSKIERLAIVEGAGEDAGLLNRTFLSCVFHSLSKVLGIDFSQMEARLVDQARKIERTWVIPDRRQVVRSDVKALDGVGTK